MSIQGIDAASVHRLTSGQVVTDLQTCVKEIVENSLDAGATSIEVRFKNYGLASIEIIDNGSGIAPADYDSVALKHYTSKLASFDDIATVRTFGFRGEALSSLCALCESVTVVTATESEAPMGTILEFDVRGRVKSRSGKAARQVCCAACNSLCRPDCICSAVQRPHLRSSSPRCLCAGKTWRRTRSASLARH